MKSQYHMYDLFLLDLIIVGSNTCERLHAHSIGKYITYIGGKKKLSDYAARWSSVEGLSRCLLIWPIIKHHHPI